MSSDTKKRCSTRSTPRIKNSTTILPTVDGLAADLRQLQDNRFRQQSKRHQHLDDWLIWVAGTKPEPHFHRLIDRLIIGDPALEASLHSLRREMQL